MEGGWKGLRDLEERYGRSWDCDCECECDGKGEASLVKPLGRMRVVKRRYMADLANRKTEHERMGKKAIDLHARARCDVARHGMETAQRQFRAGQTKRKIGTVCGRL